MAGIGATLALQAGSMALNSIGASAGDYLQRAGDKLFGIDRKKEQLEQQTKLNNLQIEGSKNLMDYSRNLQMQTWKDTNYSAQRAEMEKAGLNPAMMYGLSGGGGTTTGNSSGSVTGAHASDEASQKAVNIQQQGMALQLAKLASEIDVNKSVAEVNRANADLSGAKTNATWQEVEKLIVDTEMAKDLRMFLIHLIKGFDWFIENY